MSGVTSMKKSISDSISTYRQQLAAGDIRVAYEFLLKYVMALKASFEKECADKYSTGNVSPGYMDFTYFPFFDAYLRENKLRFGIVLNHEKIRFELWLMGQNAEVQKEYWNLLKTSKWNKNQVTMPKYSVLESVLVEAPNFEDIDALTAKIISRADSLASEITQHLKNQI